MRDTYIEGSCLLKKGGMNCEMCYPKEIGVCYAERSLGNGTRRKKRISSNIKNNKYLQPRENLRLETIISESADFLIRVMERFFYGPGYPLKGRSGSH